MQVKILGCSGGMGGSLHTTSMLVDDDILIDAGTGVGELSIEQLLKIDHIFVTHSHLDHVTSIPFLLDTVMGLRNQPVVVHALPETIQILKDHIFNWKIWPDFNAIPDQSSPLLVYEAITVGEPVDISDRIITPLPANHVVPAVGYRLDSGAGSLIFTGDTTTCEALWPYVNATDNLQYLLIETAFCNAELGLAKVAKHLCPALLAEEIANMQQSPEIFITHLKPGEGETIMQEIEHLFHPLPPRALRDGQVFNL